MIRFPVKRDVEFDRGQVQVMRRRAALSASRRFKDFGTEVSACPFVDELQRHGREEGIRQHVLFRDVVLAQVVFDGFQFRGQVVRRPV